MKLKLLASFSVALILAACGGGSTTPMFASGTSVTFDASKHATIEAGGGRTKYPPPSEFVSYGSMQAVGHQMPPGGWEYDVYKGEDGSAIFYDHNTGSFVGQVWQSVVPMIDGISGTAFTWYTPNLGWSWGAISGDTLFFLDGNNQMRQIDNLSADMADFLIDHMTGPPDGNNQWPKIEGDDTRGYDTGDSADMVVVDPTTGMPSEPGCFKAQCKSNLPPNESYFEGG